MKSVLPYGVVSLLQNTFRINADKIAIEFSEKKISYKELDAASDKIASYLTRKKKEEQFISVFAKKEFFTYASIIGILKAGKVYVPLNPKFPFERNLELIKESGSLTLLSTEPNAGDFKIFYIGEEILNSHENSDPPAYITGEWAYLLFTSGSTGSPKGVLIRHEQLVAYIENIQRIFKILPEERCSHTFELTFDLSVHDLFVTFTQGGTLVVPSENELLSPSSYIKNKNIQHWFSVPSWLKIMEKLRQLKTGSFSDLKTALFCGETLTASFAEKIKAAAANARIINLYGPTEATIAISSYEIKENAEERNGNVCIGNIFEGNEFILVDEDDNQSNKGELLLHGKQVINNYFSGSNTNDKFIKLHGKTWYRTGDIAEADREQKLFFIGRKDNQIKINGFRVELGEIEHAITSATNMNSICFMNEKNGSGILTAVIEGAEMIEKKAILEILSKKLPAYMLPQQIVYLHIFPLNTNGKIDRKKIKELISS